MRQCHRRHTHTHAHALWTYMIKPSFTSHTPTHHPTHTPSNTKHSRAATVAVKDFFGVMWVAYGLILASFLWCAPPSLPSYPFPCCLRKCVCVCVSASVPSSPPFPLFLPPNNPLPCAVCVSPLPARIPPPFSLPPSTPLLPSPSSGAWSGPWPSMASSPTSNGRTTRPPPRPATKVSPRAYARHTPKPAYHDRKETRRNCRTRHGTHTSLHCTPRSSVGTPNDSGSAPLLQRITVPQTGGAAGVQPASITSSSSCPFSGRFKWWAAS